MVELLDYTNLIVPDQFTHPLALKTYPRSIQTGTVISDNLIVVKVKICLIPTGWQPVFVPEMALVLRRAVTMATLRTGGEGKQFEKPGQALGEQ